MIKFAGYLLVASLVLCGAVGSAQATPVNIAPTFGTASASSQVFGAASNAIDGNTNTAYSGGSIFQRTDETERLLNDFSVTVFDALGNVTFNHSYATNPGDTVSTPFAITFASVIQGKAVQIILDSASPTYLALAEVQVFTDVPEPLSLSLLAGGLAATIGVRRRFAVRC